MGYSLRFQSNLIQTGVIDAGGAFTGNVVAASGSSDATLLVNPPANSGWRIRYISMIGATTVTNTTGYASLITVILGITLLQAYTNANGISVFLTPDILLNEGIRLHNLTAVNIAGSVVYRQELLP